MKKQFIVALHAQNREQVLYEAKKIIENGADGIMVVNNGGYVSSKEDYPNLFDITVELKAKYSNSIVGINPLELSNEEALDFSCNFCAESLKYSIKKPFDLLWVDNGGVFEKEGEVFLPDQVKTLLSKTLGIKSFGLEYFGGVAFKYQKQPENLEGVCKEAAKYFDTIVTSGPATGQSADVKKIKDIRTFIGNHKLALASGVTKENLSTYFDYIDTFIVGTSLLTHSLNQFVYDKQKIFNFKKVFDKLNI